VYILELVATQIVLKVNFMGDYSYLDPFRESNGSFSEAGSKNAGIFEKEKFGQHAPQQPNEPYDAYIKRVNSN
jgi:hypothetical protein